MLPPTQARAAALSLDEDEEEMPIAGGRSVRRTPVPFVDSRTVMRAIILFLVVLLLYIQFESPRPRLDVPDELQAQPEIVSPPTEPPVNPPTESPVNPLTPVNSATGSPVSPLIGSPVNPPIGSPDTPSIEPPVLEANPPATEYAGKRESDPTEAFAEAYKPFIPKREAERPKLVPGSIRQEAVPPVDICAIAKADPEWQVCDPALCPIDTNPTVLAYPRQTSWKENTGEFVNRVLQKAWGPDPPVIDLYVRAGCGGAAELRHLLGTVEVFWPRFLGEVLLVLDYPDKDILEPHLINIKTHSFHVVYEHCPCLPPRIFNQYSYLTLFRHTKADYVVTIDSDCAFHAPMTPDLLFNSKAEIIIPTSRSFQSTPEWFFDWNIHQHFFTQVHNTPWGHSMVSQPVNFKVSTFKAYLDWIQQTRGVCYESLITAKHRTGDYQLFCWMCQLTVFISHTSQPGYDIHVMDQRKDPYVRYSAHVNYEFAGPAVGNIFHDSVNLLVNQGLCRWFGPTVFPECSLLPNLAYVEKLSFHYADRYMTLNSAPNDLKLALDAIKSRLDSATKLALDEKKA